MAFPYLNPEQTANRKVAENFSGFKNLKIIYCNGKDVFDSMNAMSEAREYAINTRNPVIVQSQLCSYRFSLQFR